MLEAALPRDVSVLLLVLVAVGVLVAGTISGLTGFGFNLTSVPLLALFLPARIAIAVSLTTGLAIIVTMLSSSTIRRQVDRATTWTLLRAGVVGIPIGLTVFRFANETFLSVLVGVITLGYALVALFVRFPERRPTVLAASLAGGLSGALSSSTGLAGPPAVLYAHRSGLAAPAFRATLVAFFLPLSTASVTLMIALGLVPAWVLVLATLLIPFALGGMVLGRTTFRSLHEDRFRQVVLGFLLLIGISNIVRALL